MTGRQLFHQTQTSEPSNQQQKDSGSYPSPGAPRSAVLTPYFLLPLAFYLGLAFCYFFITPIFEAPDEWTHTGHVKYMAEGKGLPVMLPGEGIFGGQQPPLYYALGALLVQPFELDSFDDYLKNQANPHASLGYALDPGNKNNFLHTPAENFPYRGLPLTVHILRLYSMAYGLITLIFIYLTAFDLFNSELKAPCGQFTIHHSQFTILTPTPRRALHARQSLLPTSQLFPTLVALFAACQPMFTFITASVANEPANMAFCAIGLWLAQRYVLYGPSSHVGRAITLGFVLGLISLSKMTGLSFGLVLTVAFLITVVIMRKKFGVARLLWRDSIIIGMLFLAVGGWWYWRNYQLYGDFFQRGLYKIYFNIEQQPLTLGEFLYTLSTGEVSFWATFGWLNIVAPEWVYALYRIISRIGLLGIALLTLWYLWQKLFITLTARQKTSPDLPTFPPSLILHLVFPIALAFSLTRLVAIEGGLQGRQLLPALGSIAILIIWGWWTLSPARWRWPILTTLIIVMVGLAVWLPFGVVVPAYFPKPLLVEANLPADLTPLNLTYRNEMKLLGVKIGTKVAHPGDRVPVTVYWQALKPMTTNYSVFVHFVGRGYQSVGQFNTYPGLGLRPTRTLEPGQIVADTYPVQIEGGAAAPTRLLVNLGLFDFKEPGRPGIEASGPEGQPAAASVGQLKLIPAEWPSTLATPPLAEFSDPQGVNLVTLTGFTMIGCQAQTRECEITFKWLAQEKLSADYTVFIQLWPGDSEQEFIGFDAPPLSGDYPTSLWDSGEVILDPHELDLSTVPPGQYQILAGLYNLNSGVRLSANDANAPLPDNAVNLGSLRIE